MGDKIAKGVTSFGIFSKFDIGEKKSLITFKPPELFNIFTATINAIKAGIIPKTVLKLLFAPSKKISNTFSPFIAPNAIIIVTNIGKIKSVKLVIS